MTIQALKPRKALNKAYLKVKPNRRDIEGFKTNLITLLDRINDAESEEFHKNLVIDFLKKTYYDPAHFINTKGKNDLVIHNGPNGSSNVGVIIEAKKPANKAEMVTPQKLNTKAFQELVLYYLRERITLKNLAVKHLVITNIYEWYLFDVTLFDRLFAQNKDFVQQFNDFEAGRLADTKTEFFYKQIAEPYIKSITADIECTHFNLHDYQKPLRNANKADDHALIALYKLLSPEHLLKLPFANDSNSLDRRFYSELLHIIGLTETKEGGKKLIERNKAGERNTGTILEDAIIQLDSLDKISRLDKPNQFGSNQPERLFNVALELSITWINRILFLKLLEAQLITYHRLDKTNTGQGINPYSFLNLDKINSYDDLNRLFFQVLARKYDERNEDIKKVFEKVPYLNSSLFEPTTIEHSTLFISNLANDKPIPIFGQTVLKDDKGKKLSGQMPTLHYLFKFLDAYDFGAEGGEDIQEDNKTLINASVLGLIFEKINGYKDGSIFTPGFVTMYMSRETIRKAVLQKFNELKGWNCKTFEELKEDILEEIKSGNRKEVRKLTNKIINSLRVIDPAVGSGHFLVSVLNELIAIKNELKILVDADFEPLSNYLVEVVNDELIVTDEDGILFQYNPNSKESQRVQETLFREKQTIIENCLFGVDINPNSVKICRLRLWIELLKNAYYKNPTELETLPNIDINIKCGNSLVSRFAIDADLKQALKKSKWTIDGYRVAVATYRNAQDKEQKREMERLIATIKSDFRSEIETPFKKKMSDARGKAEALAMKILNLKTFGEKADKKLLSDHEKALQALTQLETERDEIIANKVYENAFEWRFEFPEVLNDEGDFKGFDVVIGNPPYIRQEAFADLKNYLLAAFTETGTGTADLFVYFVEQAFKILKPQGEFSFIIPNKWMRAGYGKKLRTFIASHQIHQLIDFGDLPVFEEATTYPNIIQLKKAKPVNTFKACQVTTLQFSNGLKNYLLEHNIEVNLDELSPEGWTLSDSKIQALLNKIKSKGVPLGNYVGGKIFYGIKTGYNEAFVIDKETRARLIAEDPKSAEVIKPFLAGREIKRYQTPVPEKFLILFPKGFTIKKNLPDTDPYFLAEPPPRYGAMPFDDAWEWIRSNYPAIASHLVSFRNQAMKRTDMGDYWWELRACDYYDEFEQPKIIYPNICKKPEFTFDDSRSYTNQKCFIITKFTLSFLGILNSSLYFFLFKAILPKLRGDFYEPSYVYFKDFPVIETESPELESLVENCLTIKKDHPSADTSELERKIDELVNGLYGLTQEEIKMVEGK